MNKSNNFVSLQSENTIKVPVTVSITMSKQMEVEVEDYEGEPVFDDEGKVCGREIPEDVLLTSVLSQHLLPYDAGEYVTPDLKEEFSNWFTDDFAVVQEDKKDYE